jgi:hypothetical protein
MSQASGVLRGNSRQENPRNAHDAQMQQCTLLLFAALVFCNFAGVSCG